VPSRSARSDRLDAPCEGRERRTKPAVRLDPRALARASTRRCVKPSSSNGTGRATTRDALAGRRPSARLDPLRTMRSGPTHARSVAATTVPGDEELRHRERHATLPPHGGQAIVDVAPRRAARRDEQVRHRAERIEVEPLARGGVPLAQERRKRSGTAAARGVPRRPGSRCRGRGRARRRRGGARRRRPRRDGAPRSCRPGHREVREQRGSKTNAAKSAHARVNVRALVLGSKAAGPASVRRTRLERRGERARELLGARRRPEAVRRADEERVVEQRAKAPERVARRGLAQPDPPGGLGSRSARRGAPRGPRGG